MSEYLLPIAIISLLILLNALFVAAEFSIVAAPKTRLVQAADRGSMRARHVLRILSNPNSQNRYLATAQIGITIASLGLGMYGEHTIADWLLHPLSRLGDAVGAAGAHPGDHPGHRSADLCACRPGRDGAQVAGDSIF